MASFVFDYSVTDTFTIRRQIVFGSYCGVAGRCLPCVRPVGNRCGRRECSAGGRLELC